MTEVMAQKQASILCAGFRQQKSGGNYMHIEPDYEWGDADFSSANLCVARTLQIEGSLKLVVQKFRF